MGSRVSIKLKFSNGSIPSPGGIDNPLPIDGVFTRHSINIDGQTIRNITSVGKHPDSAPVIIQ